MSDSLNLYRTIMSIVLESGIRIHDIRCLTTFVWAIVGVILEKGVHLSKWSLHRPGKSKAASKQRQFVRWLENAKIDIIDIYKKLARVAFEDWQGQSIFLALDSSSLWDCFVIVRIAVIYCGRALPISWMVLEHKSTSVAFEVYQSILDQAAAIIPKGCRVVLLADRGFADIDLFRKARDLGWGFRVRLKKTFRVHRAQKPSASVAQLMPARGHALFLHKVWLTDRQFGPVYLALAHVQTSHGYQEWVIVSDDPTDLRTFDEYGLRFDLEENFLDDKSSGFQIESSEIRNAEALSRLGLILATTTLYLVSTGSVIVALQVRHQVDAHWNRGLSYFQIGWRWIKFALVNSKKLLSFFCFLPDADPCPVFASKNQATKPIAILFTLRLEVS